MLDYDRSRPNYRPVQRDDSSSGPQGSSNANSNASEKSFIDYNFKLFSLCGIPIHMHYSLPFFLILNFIFWARPMAEDPGNLGYWVALVVAYNLVLWVTVLIHELGHCLAGWMVGGSSSKVVLWPLGGLAYTKPPSGVSTERRRRAQTWIALGGPLTHIPNGLFWMFLLIEESKDRWSGNVMQRPQVWQEVIYTPISDYFWYDVFVLGFAMNLWLLVLNLLLPAYPLDGSKVFMNLVRSIGGYDTRTTAWIYVFTNAAMGVGFILFAYTFLKSGSMVQFGGIWAVFQCNSMVQMLIANQEARHPLLCD